MKFHELCQLADLRKKLKDCFVRILLESNYKRNSSAKSPFKACGLKGTELSSPCHIAFCFACDALNKHIVTFNNVILIP